MNRDILRDPPPTGQTLTPVKSVVILIDHDNIELASSPRRIVAAALGAIPAVADGVSVTLRAYGGWFDGSSPTDARFGALVLYQDLCPTLIQSERGLVKVAFEFADELALSRFQSQRIEIRHTVALRRSADRLMAQGKKDLCGEVDCKLTSVRSWARKGKACFSSLCPHPFEAVFQRRQQKQVDVHLAVDLLWFVSTCDPETAIILASDDTDLLPAVLQASFQNPEKRLICLHSKRHAFINAEETLTQLGVREILLGDSLNESRCSISIS